MSDISLTSAADEHRLWLMLKAGNPAALEQLFRKYYQHLYDYGMRFYAQDDIVKDATQDVFATIWERKAFLGDVQSV
ncbi:MAG: sigma-70 family RNA polymerase sigma factor, partial [Calditrichaeota bacterium]|nr:sigma-70 family RNA polymerase sigma factor [Calditrichota bacterium]